MKKKILSWSTGAIMLLAIICVTVYSCKKNDKNNVSSSDDFSSAVVGVWSGTEGDSDYKLTFASNKTGLYEEFYHLSSGNTEHYFETFDYTMTDKDKGTIILHDDDGSYYAGDPEMLYFEIVAENMILYRYHYGSRETICLLHKE